MVASQACDNGRIESRCDLKHLRQRVFSGLLTPVPLTRWNLITLAITWGLIGVGTHFVLTPTVGVPAPAGFIAAALTLLILWSVVIRRDA